MTEKLFTGPLDRQLRDALSYLQNYIIQEKVKKVSGQAEAERFCNYPYAAVEEALSNAIYHKSYQIGEPITVVITPEQMEITSLPGPDRTISDEDLANRRMISRRYRNRRIGDFLKELRLVEGRNTGIPTILRAMKENGSPLPTFETDSDRTYLTVVLPVHASFLPSFSKKSAGRETKRTYRTVEELKSLILTALEETGASSISELAVALGYKKSTTTMRKAIQELLREEKIAYQNPDHLKDKKQKLKIIP